VRIIQICTLVIPPWPPRSGGYRAPHVEQPTPSVTAGWEVGAGRSRHCEHPDTRVSVSWFFVVPNIRVSPHRLPAAQDHGYGVDQERVEA